MPDLRIPTRATQRVYLIIAGLNFCVGFLCVVAYIASYYSAAHSGLLGAAAVALVNVGQNLTHWTEQRPGS